MRSDARKKDEGLPVVITAAEWEQVKRARERARYGADRFDAYADTTINAEDAPLYRAIANEFRFIFGDD